MTDSDITVVPAHLACLGLSFITQPEIHPVFVKWVKDGIPGGPDADHAARPHGLRSLGSACPCC